MVFSLYNPGLVYPLLDRPVPSVSEQLNVDVQSGFWRTFGYGMACMYRQDYLAAGGFPDLRTWGGEDVTLYKQFLEMEHIKVSNINYRDGTLTNFSLLTFMQFCRLLSSRVNVRKVSCLVCCVRT